MNGSAFLEANKYEMAVGRDGYGWRGGGIAPRFNVILHSLTLIVLLFLLFPPPPHDVCQPSMQLFIQFIFICIYLYFYLFIGLFAGQIKLSRKVIQSKDIQTYKRVYLKFYLCSSVFNICDILQFFIAVLLFFILLFIVTDCLLQR